MTGCPMHVATLYNVHETAGRAHTCMQPVAVPTEGGVLAWPTSLSPVLVKATTDGVVRPPSWLLTIVGLPPSMAATALLVVPRSTPTTCTTAHIHHLRRQKQ